MKGGKIRTEVVRPPVASTIWATYYAKAVRLCIPQLTAPPHRRTPVFNTYRRTQRQIACFLLHNTYQSSPTNCCQESNALRGVVICWIPFLGKILLCSVSLWHPSIQQFFSLNSSNLLQYNIRYFVFSLRIEKLDLVLLSILPT